ncbi:LysR family transcriptional regulator [Castellaniella sp. WN]
MHLSPTSLRLFVAVLEEGTIAAAAEREHIAAAAISKRISELEQTLKTPLLQRTNKGIQPTMAGMALLSMARRALHELDEISIQMHEYASGVRGFVRVYANISVITQFLPQDIKTFLEIYPNIQVHLEEKISSSVIKSVLENAADVGLFSGTHHVEHDVKVLPYREDILCLIVPKGHPLIGKPGFRFTDALEYDFIGLHTGSAINHIVANAASSRNREMKIRVQVTGFDALCFMIDSGLGIGVLPATLAKRYSRIFNIHTIPIHEPWAKRKLNICVRSLDSLPMAARLFVEHLQVNARVSDIGQGGTDDQSS